MTDSPPAARPFVIAIGGPSGSGKSSLVNRTANLLGDATTLFFDDYASVSEYPTDLTQWLHDGANPNEWKTPRFATDLTALRRGESIEAIGSASQRDSARYIVVEEPFGRNRREMRQAIDLAAVVDLPLEVALARRIRRNLESAVNDNAASIDCVRSLSQFLDAYLDGSLREGYLAINRAALASCDVVLDGMKSIDELAEQVIQAARGWNRIL